MEVAYNGIVKIQNRTRYNFWDLLGDVGGFNDGLFLLCSLFMSSYSALAYKIDFLDGRIVEDDLGEKKAFENSERFKKAIDRINSNDTNASSNLDKN